MANYDSEFSFAALKWKSAPTLRELPQSANALAVGTMRLTQRRRCKTLPQMLRHMSLVVIEVTQEKFYAEVKHLRPLMRSRRLNFSVGLHENRR